jgi:hypothetical protein
MRTLERARIRDEDKSARRDRVLRNLDYARENGYHAAIKPWLSAFIFTGQYGERDRLSNSDIIPFLQADNNQPSDELITIQQLTRLYSPNGTYRGQIPSWQLAEDLSNILLMDALMGQHDRFAGANLHFMSVDGHLEENGERRNMPIFEMGQVRLLALDNGAALRSRHGSGLDDLRGARISGTRIERFERSTVERLRGVSRRLGFSDCEHPPFEDEVAAIWDYFGLDESRRERASGYFIAALEYLDELEDDFAEDMFLNPVHSDTEEPVLDIVGQEADTLHENRDSESTDSPDELERTDTHPQGE